MASRVITYREALTEALAEEMARDAGVFIMGEDIAEGGGIFGVTKGLLERFGPERVRNTPISEAGFAGAGLGAALTGTRPVVEIMFIDWITLAFDQIVNQAAKIRFHTGGQAKVPVVFRTQGGSGRGNACHHSQSLEALFVHAPGLVVVMPSTPYDAKGLLKASIRDDNPVLFVENKRLYAKKGSVPEEDYVVPIGVTDVKRQGSDVTVVATSLMVLEALAVADKLAFEGIEVEVVDPRTLKPLDIAPIAASVAKTGRAVVATEACKTGSFAAELVAVIMETSFDYLEAPVERVAALDAPIPYNKKLELQLMPSREDMERAIRRTLE